MLSSSVVFDCFVTPWTVARQVPLSLGFPRQEYWGGLPFPSPGVLPDPGIKPQSPVSPALQADSLPAIRHSAKSEMNCPSSLDFEACEPPRVPSCQAPLQLLQKGNVCWVIKRLFCHYNNQSQTCTDPSIVCRNKWGESH